eukprot:TRINITY_DN677_c0_g1_i1.p1 TRINITY_DN677_c0_g1~~TRINITY_DN677_c0_g1_i1.p1  ORF type:complete len:525 (-),score=147.17 TRINITY_DN677_c0_g1_i1:128-1483(-)
MLEDDVLTAEAVLEIPSPTRKRRAKRPASLTEFEVEGEQQLDAQITEYQRQKSEHVEQEEHELDAQITEYQRQKSEHVEQEPSAGSLCEASCNEERRYSKLCLLTCYVPTPKTCITSIGAPPGLKLPEDLTQKRDEVVDAEQLPMDKLLRECFLLALASHAENLQLPLKGTRLYTHFMRRSRPSDSSLDVKKSSYASLKNFLEQLQSEGLVSLEPEESDPTITEIHWNHPVIEVFTAKARAPWRAAAEDSPKGAESTPSTRLAAASDSDMDDGTSSSDGLMTPTPLPCPAAADEQIPAADAEQESDGAGMTTKETEQSPFFPPGLHPPAEDFQSSALAFATAWWTELAALNTLQMQYWTSSVALVLSDLEEEKELEEELAPPVFVAAHACKGSGGRIEIAPGDRLVVHRRAKNWVLGAKVGADPTEILEKGWFPDTAISSSLKKAEPVDEN